MSHRKHAKINTIPTPITRTKCYEWLFVGKQTTSPNCPRTSKDLYRKLQEVRHFKRSAHNSVAEI